MPEDPGRLAGGDDPYLTWVRATQGAGASPDPQLAPGPQLEPTVPGTGIPASAVDPYVAWAQAHPHPQPGPGPITAPDQSPAGPANKAPSGPVTSPDQSPASGRAFNPRNDYGGPDALGGNADPVQRAQVLAGMTPEQQAAAVDSMSPEEKLRYEATRTRAALLRQAELEHNAAADSERRAREDVEMQRAAVAKADADTREVMARADQLANTKIDNNRYAKSLSAAGKIGTVLLSAIGGAFAENTGGHNLALEQFNRQVSDDIAGQHADLANQWHAVDLRRNAIAAEYDRHGDLYKAQETYRQAAYTSAINDMQSQLQQFDPAGGTALAIRNQIDQFRGAQQQNILAFTQQQFKNDIESRKDSRETALARSTISKNAAETAKLYTEAANAKASNELLTPAEIQRRFPGLPYEAIPPKAMTTKELSQHVETFNKTQETQAKTRENQVQESSTVVRNPQSGDVLNVDATKARLRPEDAAKLTEKIGQTQTFVDTLADLRHVLDSDPSSLDRKTWQSYKTRLELAKTDFIQAMGAKASSREMQAVEGIFGTDFDHYRDRVKDRGTATAALDAVIDHAKSSLDTELLSRAGVKDGYKIIRDTSRLPPKPLSPQEQAIKQTELLLGTKPNIKPDAAFHEAYHDAYEAALKVDPTDQAAALAAARKAAAAAEAEHKSITPTQRKEIAVIAEHAQTGDETSLKILTEASKNSDAPLVRKLAKAALDDALRRNKATRDAETLDATGLPTGDEDVPEPTFDRDPDAIPADRFTRTPVPTLSPGGR